MSSMFINEKRTHYELLTPSAEEYIKDNSLPWKEYPRPQMKRCNYQILNGEWKLNGNMTTVPFPPQSRLSGYTGEINDILVYEKNFVVSDNLNNKQGRILLHFGAVDQVAKVWVNDVFVGEHEGGYLPFYFDITDALCNGENTLRVLAVDTLSHDYPYGKQKRKPGGMWYTQVSGIWQSVWLERVPSYYMERIKLTPDLDGVDVELTMAGNGSELVGVSNSEGILQPKTDTFSVSITLHNGQTMEKTFDGLQGRIHLSNIILEDGSTYIPKLWTTDEPYLYSMMVCIGEDKVETYFALRTINIEETHAGKRVCLNGTPIFLHGVLDQGYYPEGIYLPAKEKEYEADIIRMKELGINMLRKHIKVEPEAFYYACDRLGMLVMQDMVNSGTYSFVFDTAFPTIGLKKRPDGLFPIKGKRKEFFVKHCKDTIEHLYNHPGIIAYTIFNEGWGQFCSDKLYDMVKEWDPTRLVDSTSGWFAQMKNDFDSEHIYFRVVSLKVKERPLFMSECGGYSMVVEGHQYSKDKEYGYGACSNGDELTDKIINMYGKMIVPSVAEGLCGCVYTQLSDVEEEVNGLYTYDRKVCKVDKIRMKELAEQILSKL